jgi:16S rRNA (guanine1207-N2)-methyltransferase
MAHADRLALAFRDQGLTLPDTGTILVLRATPSAFLESLPRDRLLAEQGFRPTHDALAARGLRVTPRADEPAAMVVVNLGRSRAESLGDAARGLGLLPPGGRLVVNGARTDGIDGIARQLAAELPLEGVFAKAHGRVVWLARPARLPAAVAAWAEAAALRPNAGGFLTAPGMFSPEGPDPGSARLAAHFPGRLAGRVADLGAGWGWLAHTALAACPAIAAIDLYEAEARALEAARANITDPRAAFHWADAAALGRGGQPYDAVIANPPFHHGRAAEPGLGAGFIGAAARILKPSGSLLMVANRQLPYEAPLDAAFRQWERLSEDAAYKVFLAAHPRRA